MKTNYETLMENHDFRMSTLAAALESLKDSQDKVPEADKRLEHIDAELDAMLADI